MAKETMLSYLDEKLEKFPYDTAIDWDTRNHTIEIVCRLFGENKEQLAIDDAEGVLSEEEVIMFEDGVLIYDKHKSNFDKEDYLAAIPFNGKKGLEKAVIDALLLYLKEVLDQGQDELLDFLADDEQEIFELKWDTEYFARLTADKIGGEKLPYPSY